MIRELCFLVFILHTLTVDLINAKECITPYKENATCLAVSKCDVISSALFTLTPRAIQFYKDSQCGCDEGMVCCGTSNNKTYQKLINCAPAPQPLKLTFVGSSDTTLCGLDSSTDRIVGGRVVKPGEFPWVAALEYKNKFTKENAGIRCAGSIITNRFILTAAHCILDVEFEVIKIWLGMTNITSDETCFNKKGEIQCIKTVKKFNVEKFIPHEFYNSMTKFNDIGLLKLDTDIEFTDYIRQICVPEVSSESPSLGTHLTVVGWGATETGTISNVKRKVELPLQDNKICEEYLSKRYRNISEKQLCVGGERGKDSCEGDSGGPLMYEFIGANDDVQWYQHGIVSYGTGCGLQGRPGVYIKVSSYATWIGNKIINWKWNLAKDEPCTTQNGTLGMCVPLRECHEVFKKIFSKSEYFSYQEELRKNQCSYLNRDFMVCCNTPGSSISYKFNSTTGVLPDSTCGILKKQPGIEDEMVDLPWIAGIEVSYPQNATTAIKCIGTVIHSRYILTTDRCVFGKEDDTFIPLNVLLGRWREDPSLNPVQRIGIKKIIPYPATLYYPYSTYVLILLQNQIKFSDSISPICLNLRILPKLKAGDKVTSVRLSEPVTLSDLIFKEELPLFNCSYWNEDVDSTGVCKTGENKDDCNREIWTTLRAPIMRRYEDGGRIQWYLVALSVWELPCQGNLRISIDIIDYLDWIITIISENN